MTGFARAEATTATHAWAWEARSVNGRGLDLRCRLPPGFEVLEAPARSRLAEALTRGSVNLVLRVERSEGASEIRINEVVLAELVARARSLREALPEAVLAIDGLLAVRGVVEPLETSEDEAARRARETAMLASLDEVVRALVVARGEEGERLARVLGEQLDEMEALIERAASSAGARAEAVRERLSSQLRALLAERIGIAEERLAQELALLAVKADVGEELDRLSAHVAQAAELIAEGGAVGRRLDFLAQEFNREANTLTSKSGDIELTRIGLDLKVVIDRFREQVQNIE